MNDTRYASLSNYLVNSEIREEGLGFFIADRWVNNNIISLLPIDGSSDTVLITNL